MKMSDIDKQKSMHEMKMSLQKIITYFENQRDPCQPKTYQRKKLRNQMGRQTLCLGKAQSCREGNVMIPYISL